MLVALCPLSIVPHRSNVQIYYLEEDGEVQPVSTPGDVGSRGSQVRESTVFLVDTPVGNVKYLRPAPFINFSVFMKRKSLQLQRQHLAQFSRMKAEQRIPPSGY